MTYSHTLKGGVSKEKMMEIKECSNCHKELKEEIQNFCKKCDKKLSFKEKIHLLSNKLDLSISRLSQVI